MHLRVTILPRIEEGNKQTTGVQDGSPSQTQTQTLALWDDTGVQGGGGEGYVPRAGAAEALLLREGTDQGTFLVP